MIRLDIDTAPIDRAVVRVRGLRSYLPRPVEITKGISEGLLHQTRYRIWFEKTAPDEKRWAPWSPRYARTRRAQHSLLIDTHDLVDTLQKGHTATTATVFSRLPYAGAHQDSRREWLPSRPYLGMSDANIRDMEFWLGPRLEALFQRFLPRTLGGR